MSDPTIIPITSTLIKEIKHNGSAFADYRWDSPNTAVRSDFNLVQPGTAQTHDRSKNSAAVNVSLTSPFALLEGYVKECLSLWVPWWGHNTYSHINIGYSDVDQLRCNSHADYIKALGHTGMVINYYGKGYNNAQYLMRNALAARNLKMMVMVDSNGDFWGTDKTGSLIDIFTQDIAPNFIRYSTNYLTYNGRPVVMDFGLERYSIDWPYVRAHLQSEAGINPIWLARNNPTAYGGFVDGFYGWPEAGESTASYLSGFYTKALANPTKVCFAPLYKGFYDNLSCPKDDITGKWCAGAIRDIPQNNGQTYLDCINALRSHYTKNTTTPPVLGVMPATFNDYEEGTAIETGINAGFLVTASVASGILTWNVTGNLNALHHIIVWASTDGVNLTRIGSKLGATAASGNTNLNLMGLAVGNYTIYVQAVGHSGFLTAMSSAMLFAVTTAVPPPVTVGATVELVSVSTKLAAISVSLSDDSLITGIKATWPDGSPVAGLTLPNISSKVVLAPIMVPNGVTSITITVWQGTIQVGTPIVLAL